MAEKNISNEKKPFGLWLVVVGLIINLLTIGSLIGVSVIGWMFSGFGNIGFYIMIFFAVVVAYCSAIVGIIKMKNWGKWLSIIISVVFIIDMIIELGSFYWLNISIIVISALIISYLLFNKKVKEAFK